MQAFLLPILASLLAGIAYAVPQQKYCATVTTTVTVPSSTKTFYLTPFTVTTVTESTARNDGTDTIVTTISSTTTLETITSTTTDCTASGAIANGPTTTIYTTAGAAKVKRSPLQFQAREDAACAVTKTSTVGGGLVFSDVYVNSTRTSTYLDYPTWTVTATTETAYNGRAYAIATAFATTSAFCGPTVDEITAAPTSTTTQDARCAPSSLTSAYNGYGLEYAEDVVAGGATYDTTASDGSACCQLCAEAASCASSAWDIRTGKCTLDFPVDFDTGALNCGEGMLAFYDAGPNSPMQPGTGLFVQALCGNVEFGSAKPDDGT